MRGVEEGGARGVDPSPAAGGAEEGGGGVCLLFFDDLAAFFVRGVPAPSYRPPLLIGELLTLASEAPPSMLSPAAPEAAMLVLPLSTTDLIKFSSKGFSLSKRRENADSNPAPV